MSNHILSDLPVPIYKPTSPKRPNQEATRTVTETSFLTQTPSFTVPKLHKHHHHPHIHRHHKDKDEKFKDGANKLETAAESEAITPEDSKDPSRRTSLLDNNNAKWEVDGLPLATSWKEERRVVRDVEVVQEKERSALRATELRNSLNSLNTLSNDTTRRLDNTYYTVLEKLSTLSSTIASLKELANMTRQLNEEFKKEADGVVQEVLTSVDGYEGFEEQGKCIEGLAQRVKEGREKIKMLGERVQVVKERVDGWENAEEEWRERARKRLKVLWIIIASCGLLIFGLLAFQYAPAKTQGPAVMKGMNSSAFEGALPDLEQIRNETWSLKRKTEDALEKMKARGREKEKEEEDPRLRMFDEL